MGTLLREAVGVLGTTIGMIKATPEVAVEAFLAWQQPIGKRYGYQLTIARFRGPVNRALEGMLPLVSPVRTKHLFIATRSEWSAFFDNGAAGTDAASTMAVLAQRIGAPALRATCVPQSLPDRPKRDSGGSWGANIVELFDERGATRRSIFCANDGGKWKFGQTGVPLPFETVDKYDAKRIRDRFGEADLRAFLNGISIDAFDDDAYPSVAEGYVVLRSSGQDQRDLSRMGAGARTP
jgi:hypothetical protein